MSASTSSAASDREPDVDKRRETPVETVRALAGSKRRRALRHRCRGKIIGLLTRQALGEVMMIRAARPRLAVRAQGLRPAKRAGSAAGPFTIVAVRLRGSAGRRRLSRNADLRRYPATPARPAKPRPIMTQVDGSGMAEGITPGLNRSPSEFAPPGAAEIAAGAAAGDPEDVLQRDQVGAWVYRMSFV